MGRKYVQMGKEPTQVGRGDVPRVQTSGNQVTTDAPSHSGKESFFTIFQVIPWVSKLLF